GRRSTRHRQRSVHSQPRVPESEFTPGPDTGARRSDADLPDGAAVGCRDKVIPQLRVSWLPTRVAPCPTDHTLTWLLEMLNMVRVSLGSNQCKCADIRIRQNVAEPSRRGEQGAALGDYVIDQYNALQWRYRGRGYEAI